MTGLIALLLLPVFLVLLERSEHWFGLRPGALSLAVFHSMFIGLGVLVFLPLTGYFATFVQRILHNQRPDITDHLDDTLLPLPEVALAASQRALGQIAQSFLDHAASLLATQTAPQVSIDLVQSRRLLDETFSFVSRISVPASDQRSTAQRISQLHAIDHLMRLRNRLQEPILSHDVIEREVCAPTLITLKKMIERARNGLAEQRLQIELTSLAHEAEVITAHALEARGEVLRSNAAGSQGHSSEALLRVTDTLRWLERTAQHIWRISYYLQQEKPENLANQSKS